MDPRGCNPRSFADVREAGLNASAGRSDQASVQADGGTRLRPAAVSASGIHTPALARATDRLLDAAGGRANLPLAAAGAAVAEIADWCAVDVVRDDGRLMRAGSARAADVDVDAMAGLLARFAVPDPALLARVDAARGAVRVDDPDWTGDHTAIAAPISEAGKPCGLMLLLVRHAPAEDADDLLFAAGLGVRLAQTLELVGAMPRLGGNATTESGRESGHSPNARLRRNLSEGELRLELEPIANVVSREIAGAEAVVAWRQATGGGLRPGTTGRLGADEALAASLGPWARAEACKMTAELEARGLGIAISLDLAAADLARRGIAAELGREAQLAGASPRSLIIEVSEATVRSAGGNAVAELADLRNAGFRIALEDFGASGEAPADLLALPMDILKLSPELVAGADRDPANAARLTAVAELGMGLDVDLIADGVTTEGELGLVAELGCRWAQGAAVGRPRRLGELVERIRS